MPQWPQFIALRSVRRVAAFVDDNDFAHYRQCLGDTLRELGIALHAYALMAHHVQLLVTPSAPGRLPIAMRRLEQRYVPIFNRKHERTGALWEGRFESCLVDSDDYLLAVHRYIELNPVRAALVALPDDYRWSSVHASLATAVDPIVAAHPVFLATGPDPAWRGVVHRASLRQAISDDDLLAIRMYLRQGGASGNPRSKATVERPLNRPATIRTRSRPWKTTADPGACALA
jgi:putative transposase